MKAVANGPHAHLQAALAAIRITPTHAPAWHTLANALQGCADAALRQQILQRVRSEWSAEGITGFLRTTLLLHQDGFRPEDFAALAACVEGQTPLICERAQALLVHLSLATLSGSGQRQRQIELHRAGGTLRILNTIADALAALSVIPPRRPSPPGRRLALLAPHLIGLGHAPTRLVLQHAALLARRGFEVRISSVQEHANINFGALSGVPLSQTQGLATESWGLVLPQQGVEAVVGDSRRPLLERWVTILQDLYAFNPDTVLFVGLHTPVAQCLYRDFPVVGLSFHGTAPLAPVDVWLRAAASGPDVQAQWGTALPECAIVHHPYRLARLPSGPTRTRAELGLRTQSVVLVSVGYRLNTEIEGAFAARMAVLLLTHPEVEWLLVGAPHPPALAGAAGVKTLAAQTDLGAVLRACDIFVNPPRTGGGFSVADALGEGLPVVALSDSDGGDKLGALASDSLDSYFVRLKALIEDTDFRRRESQASRTLYADTLELNDAAGAALERAFTLAHARWQTRQALKASS